MKLDFKLLLAFFLFAIPYFAKALSVDSFECRVQDSSGSTFTSFDLARRPLPPDPRMPNTVVYASTYKFSVHFPNGSPSDYFLRLQNIFRFELNEKREIVEAYQASCILNPITSSSCHYQPMKIVDGVPEYLPNTELYYYESDVRFECRFVETLRGEL